MKSKLIPKGQLGWLSKLSDKFIGAAMAENPAVMTASGWLLNNGNWELESSKDSKQLADNLAAISTFSPTNPVTAIGDKIIKSVPVFYKAAKNTAQVLLPKANIHTKNWSLTLPKVGDESIAYRLIAKDGYEDAIKSGVIRPQTLQSYNAKLTADIAKQDASAVVQGLRRPILLRKHFGNHVMFNKEKPFYGNPLPFTKSKYDHVIIGNLDNPRINWVKVNHKGHKNIVEPTINGKFETPSSEFEFWKRAPLNFGWKRIPLSLAAVGDPAIILNGKKYYMPNLMIDEVNRGKEAAAKFFEHPVVKQSHEHNKELAKRLEINLDSRPDNISEIIRLPINVKWSGALGNNLATMSLAYFGDKNALLTFNWKPFDTKTFGITNIHENLHRGYYSAPIRFPLISKEYYNDVYKPSYLFYKWKTDKLLKSEYREGYLGDVLGGEAGPNLIDMGRDLGLKLGLKYPGYELTKQMLLNYKGFKSFIVPQLNDSKAGMRHAWDAMTGKYFAIPTTLGISQFTLNKNSQPSN